MIEHLQPLLEHIRLANELYGPVRPEGVMYGLGGIISAIGSIFGSRRSSRQRVEANEQASIDLQQAHRDAQEEYRGTLDKNLTQIQDYLDLGKEQFVSYRDNVRAGKYVQHPFRFTRQSLENDPGRPGYDFALQQGLQAIQRNAAARGGLISGNALREAARYATGAANVFTNDAFQRAQQTYATNQGQLDKQHAQDRYLFDVGTAAQYDAVRQRELASQGIVNARVGEGNAAAAGSLGAGYARAQGTDDITNILFGDGLSRGGGTNVLDTLSTLSDVFKGG